MRRDPSSIVWGRGSHHVGYLGELWDLTRLFFWGAGIIVLAHWTMRGEGVMVSSVESGGGS